MKHHMVDIVPLEPAFLDPVARLHIAHLHTSYRGYAGRQLLVCYYQTLAQASTACGYVAVEKGDVAGFVCGVWDGGKLRSDLLKQHLANLLLWGTFQILSQPSMFGHLLKRVRLLFNSSGDQPVFSQSGYELRPIVVDPYFRGTEVANKLVDRLIRDADQRGFEQMYLYAEEDNTAANAFYRKVGFEFVSKHCVDQTVYLRYEISTSEKLL